MVKSCKYFLFMSFKLFFCQKCSTYTQKWHQKTVNTLKYRRHPIPPSITLSERQPFSMYAKQQENDKSFFIIKRQKINFRNVKSHVRLFCFPTFSYHAQFFICEKALEKHRIKINNFTNIQTVSFIKVTKLTINDYIGLLFISTLCLETQCTKA